MFTDSKTFYCYASRGYCAEYLLNHINRVLSDFSVLLNKLEPFFPPSVLQTDGFSQIPWKWPFSIFIIRLHLLPLFLVWHSPSLSPSFSPSLSLQQTHCERKTTVICHVREVKTERMRGRDGGWGNERGGGGNEKERERQERITFPFSPLSFILVCHEKWRRKLFHPDFL